MYRSLAGLPVNYDHADRPLAVMFPEESRCMPNAMTFHSEAVRSGPIYRCFAKYKDTLHTNKIDWANIDTDHKAMFTSAFLPTLKASGSVCSDVECLSRFLNRMLKQTPESTFESVKHERIKTTSTHGIKYPWGTFLDKVLMQFNGPT